ncbi:serine/threonine-protein kinase [Saccharothrix australiensis]|uniref:non-specific serine/threonine protein kinase n=1 Tax=Saccharothrix australiensis TaxID=2072 RepID=A0A495W983_9PSEU|nr:serine/threonine-protein kinase [Saccharothrix australiensis]RKT57670.1 serine/threonine protein kinase [Saccharothrix australiensis]
MHRSSGGTIGDRYRLVERVGNGAMGVVWRAHDPVLDREVAVKQLRWPDLTPAAAEVAAARAMREARNAARLHHPHAVAVFDVVVEDDRPWLVMEYVPARSLAALLAEHGPLDAPEAARICGYVAEALAAAHAAGIAHRDVKPSNVLIGHDGAVKLTDFGISRAVDDGTLTDSGMITGTPAYLAPEVARGGAPDPASDVFSLGATLYAATEGSSPYGASDNSLGLLYKAANGEIAPPARDTALAPVLTRLLSIDPAERPTAAEVVDLLAADPPAERRQRRGWLAPAIAAVILLAAAGTVTAVSLTSPPAPAHSPSGDAAPAVPPESEVADFVTAHYAKVTDDPHAAWQDLAPSFRPDIAEYTGFWGQYAEVHAEGVVAARHDDTRYLAEVQLTFVRDSGPVTERYRLLVESAGGRLQIVHSEPI